MPECRHCKLEVSVGAKKCPHCLGWQSTWMPDPQSPRGMMMFVAVPLLILLPAVLFFTRSLGPGDPSEIAPHLVITDSALHHSIKSGGTHYVAIVGTIRNGGSTTVKNPHFSVRFLNAQGQLIDSLAESDYDLIISPSAELTFRIRGPAQQPESEYSAYEIIVTGASEARLF